MAKTDGFIGSLSLPCAVLSTLAVVVSCGGQQNLPAPTETATTELEAFLSGHNKVRAEVTQPASYPGTWAPLPAMVWSEDVAASARVWGEHLRDTENCNALHEDSSNLGENIAYGTVGFSASAAIKLWADEKSDPGYVFNPVYTFDAKTGHYTQMVWRDSIQLGCSTTRCSGNFEGYLLHVCRYSPGGNVDGDQPY
jgi:pathogenesis-related protein 1